MPIFEDSRYVTAPIVALADSAGVYHATLLKHVADVHAAYDVMVSEEGDTFATVAWDAYRDAEQWWRVADLNDHIFYPDDLPVGSLVKVPRVASSS